MHAHAALHAAAVLLLQVQGRRVPLFRSRCMHRHHHTSTRVEEAGTAAGRERRRWYKSKCNMKATLYTLLVASFGTIIFAICPEAAVRPFPELTPITNKVKLKFSVLPPVEFAKHGITLPLSGVPPALRAMSVSADQDMGSYFATSPFLPSRGTARLRKAFRGGYSFLIEFEKPELIIELEVSNDGHATGSATHNFYRPEGVVLVQSILTQSEGVKALENAIVNNPNGPKLIQTIDHAKAAKSVDLELPPSTVIVFGNPKLGTPLWVLEQATGIELPLEVLIAESPLGIVYVFYNAPAGLLRRFGLEKVAGVLEKVDGALAKLASVASGKDLKPAGLTFDVNEDDGSRLLAGIEAKSRVGLDTVMSFETLVAALTTAPPVNIAYQVPHDLSAKSAGIETDGKICRVAVFGNPALGTSLMQASFSAALDLPLKMAVWNSGDNLTETTAGFTTPEWIAERHNVGELDPRLGAAIRNLASVALTPKK